MTVKPAIRVAMVCSQAPPVYGGAGMQALGLARGLRARGVRADLLTQNQSRASRSESFDGVRILRAPGERAAGLMPARAGQVARTLSFITWLLVRLAFGRYDVIHLHGSYWFVLPAVVAGRLRRRPLVVKVTRLGEDDALSVTTKRVGPIPVGRLYGSGFRHAAMTIALSRVIEDRHRSVFPGKPVMLQPNGVDVARFQAGHRLRASEREKLGIPSESFVALFVGYLAPHKGVGVLLDAWQRFSDGRGAYLLLVGPSSGFYRELDDAVSDRAKGASQVIAIDHASFADMPAIYAAADVFVLPTQAEGMPNSLLEALASGLPAIASDVPGVVDVADRAEGVVTLPAVTADAITSALCALADRPSGGSRAPKLPPEFALGSVADAYVQLYTRLLADVRDGRSPT